VFTKRSDDIESEKYLKLLFIVEQIYLLFKSKYDGNYSPQLVIISNLISVASTSAYGVLLDEHVPSLASRKSLSNVITKRLDGGDGLRAMFLI